jgi:16S rRNA U516 pseudouridylate synthase RsuA-like enzyme
MGRILLFNKLFGVICQFSRDGVHQTLADYTRFPIFIPRGAWTPTAKALLVLTNREGKSHQIRRMSTAVGLPTLRLILVDRIGESTLSGLEQGMW